MSYIAAQSDPNSMSTEELFAEIESFKVLAGDVVKRLSLLLQTLRARRQPHSFFSHPVLRFFQFIADDRLDPQAALLLSNVHLIKAVLPLSREDQRELAQGREVETCHWQAPGVTGTEFMPIRRMDLTTLKRTFGPEGIRPIAKQEAILRESGQVHREGMITILREEMALKIGNQKIKPEELRGPLMALGYSLELARNVTAKAG